MQTTMEQLSIGHVKPVSVICQPGGLLNADSFHEFSLPMHKFLQEGFRLFDNLVHGVMMGESTSLYRFAQISH